MPIIKRKIKNKIRYQARINYVDSFGKYKTKNSKLFETKAEAEREEARLRIELNKVESNSLTFDELYTSYNEYQKDKVRVQTHEKYDEIYNHIKPFLANVQIDKLTIPMYEQFKKELDKQGHSYSMKCRIHRFIKTLLKHANIIYNIHTNVVERAGGFVNPNESKQEMKIMTYDDFRKFINEFEENKIYKALFLTLYFEGLRRGEANALTWKDIDFKKHTMNVNKTVCKTKGGYVCNPPKTKSSIRIIPMDSEVEDSLRDLYNWYSRMVDFSDDWRVFGGVKELGDTTIAKKKNQACMDAKIEPVRIHDFRHSCASYYINLGAPILLVSKLLGHTDIAMTLNTYSHLYPNEMESIFEKSKEFKGTH